MPHPAGHHGRWRKKPVDVEALQFEVGWTDEKELLAFTEDADDSCQLHYGTGPGGLIASLSIVTLEGEMKVNDGDYIVKGVQHELYPCKPDIFEATYRPIS